MAAGLTGQGSRVVDSSHEEARATNKSRCPAGPDLRGHFPWRDSAATGSPTQFNFSAVRSCTRPWRATMDMRGRARRARLVRG